MIFREEIKTSGQMMLPPLSITFAPKSSIPINMSFILPATRKSCRGFTRFPKSYKKPSAWNEKSPVTELKPACRPLSLTISIRLGFIALMAVVARVPERTIILLGEIPTLPFPEREAVWVFSMPSFLEYSLLLKKLFRTPS